MHPNGRHALELARAGFRIFPLAKGAKTPAIKNWQRNATTDEDTIKRWWQEQDYNVGLATGKGVVVLDYDMKPGQSGEAALKAHEALGLSEVLRVKTPNGLHVYYETDAPIPNSASKIAPHVDVRGDGGYVVAPGSTVGGKLYECQLPASL